MKTLYRYGFQCEIVQYCHLAQTSFTNYTIVCIQDSLVFISERGQARARLKVSSLRGWPAPDIAETGKELLSEKSRTDNGFACYGVFCRVF